MSARESNIKIYGLKRSWTNLAAWLIDHHLVGARAWHEGPGWKRGDLGDKHNVPARLPAVDGYLFCVKDPYGWVASMRRYGVRNPTRVLVGLWNRRGRQYVTAVAAQASCSQPVLLIRYEEVLRDTRGVIEKFGSTFDLALADTRCLLPKRAMRRSNDKVRHLVSDRTFDVTYYTERRYLEELGSSVVEEIAAGLDLDLAALLGYG